MWINAFLHEKEIFPNPVNAPENVHRDRESTWTFLECMSKSKTDRDFREWWSVNERMWVSVLG